MSLSRKLAFIGLVYVIEGFPMGVYAKVWPLFFTRHDVPLTEIGLLSGVSAAWFLKVLWSPLVDRFGERRQWIAACMLAMAVCLAGIAGVDMRERGLLLWLLLWGYCLASATQDVAIDAYAIGLADRGEEGPINSMKIVAYRGGMVLSGAGLLFLPRWIGWPGTFLAAAVLSVALAASAFACPRVPVPLEARRHTIAPLKRWLSRGGALPVLGFVLLFRVGDRAMGPMVTPFLAHRGLPNEEIATLESVLAVAATIAGAIAGGGIVARLGIGRALWLLGALALGSNFGYAIAAAVPESGRFGVYGASLIESFCSGLVSAAFLSYLMRICEKEHAAVQYALLTAVYGLAGTLVAMPSGWLTEQLGYASFFGITAGFALPAFVFLPAARAWLGEDRPANTPPPPSG